MQQAMKGQDLLHQLPRRNLRTRSATHWRDILGDWGTRLRTLRVAHGLTQSMLATKVSILPITLSRLEREQTILNLPLTVTLAQHYAIDLRWLATGIGPVFLPTSGLHILAATQSRDAYKAAVDLIARSTIPYDIVKVETPRHGNIKPHNGWLIRLTSTADALVIIIPTQLHRQEDEYGTHQLLQAGHRLLGPITLSTQEAHALTHMIATNQIDHPSVRPDIPTTVRRWLKRFTNSQQKDSHTA